MARAVGLEWHHRAIYWSGSQPTHASAIGVDDYLTIGSNKQPIYRLGLSGRHTRAELAADSDSLIRGLIFLDEAFTLGLKPTYYRLIAEYSNAMGVDPLMPEL